MAYIDKTTGEKLIETMYKIVKKSIKHTDKSIEENKIAGYNTSFLKGSKYAEIALLKNFIREVRELEG